MGNYFSFTIGMGNWGAIKLHLPVEAFIACSQTKRPDNTLFPDICSFNVGYSDLETYLPLILGLFEVSPEGGLVF